MLGLVFLFQADRSVLTAQLNLHSRDLRLLDPMLTQIHPSAILCRCSFFSFPLKSANRPCSVLIHSDLKNFLKKLSCRGL